MKRCKVDSIAGISLEEARKKRTEIHEAYLAEARKGHENRKEHLDQLAKALAEQKDTTKETELKNLRQREKQRNQARRIRRMRGKKKSGKVTTMCRTLA